MWPKIRQEMMAAPAKTALSNTAASQTSGKTLNWCVLTFMHTRSKATTVLIVATANTLAAIYSSCLTITQHVLQVSSFNPPVWVCTFTCEFDMCEQWSLYGSNRKKSLYSLWCSLWCTQYKKQTFSDWLCKELLWPKLHQPPPPSNPLKGQTKTKRKNKGVKTACLSVSV